MDLKNKRIFITGAAKGIGAELASYFSSKGANLIVCDIDLNSLEQKYGHLENCTTCKLDVRNTADWAKAINLVSEGLDYMFNVAGVIRPGYILETDDDEIDLQIDVNLKGVIYGTKYAAQVMEKNGGGHIINIASMAGLAPISGISVYSASKFGVRGFSLAMALELADKGIQVSVVAPDAVDTPMLEEQKDEEAAALVFSADKLLTSERVRKVIVKEVMQNRKTEVWIPFNRGVQAYLGATFPKAASFVLNLLKSKGLKKQASYRKSH